MISTHTIASVALLAISIPWSLEAPQTEYQYYYFPRVFRSIQNIPYLPPNANEHIAKNEYLPPERTQIFPAPADNSQLLTYLPPQKQFEIFHIQKSEVAPQGDSLTNYIPAEIPQNVQLEISSSNGNANSVAGAQGQSVSVRTDTREYPTNANVNCNYCPLEKQRSDIEPEDNSEETNGYDYPKPQKAFDLPTPNVPSPARTLEQELPTEETYTTTTTETTDGSNNAETTVFSLLSTSPPSQQYRLSRSSVRERPSSNLRLYTNPESGPVHIKTLPFQIESSHEKANHRRTTRGTMPLGQPKIKREAQSFGGGRPVIQISPPKPGPYHQNVQISPPKPGPYHQNVQISPPKPGPYHQNVQISPPRPGPYRNPQVSPPRPYRNF